MGRACEKVLDDPGVEYSAFRPVGVDVRIGILFHVVRIVLWKSDRFGILDSRWSAG